MAPDFEIVVVGGGVIGLAIAYQLGRSGHDVLVLERNARVGSETSSRNSEVIHAGLYYPTGSLKASLCVKGKQMLYQFASDNGIPHRRVGKLLVATSSSEIAKLAIIGEQAVKNGVSDLIPLTAAEARALSRRLIARQRFFRRLPASSIAMHSCRRSRDISAATGVKSS